MSGPDVIERDVPEHGDCRRPDRHTVRAKRADDVDALVKQPVYEYQAERQAGLQAEPVPAFQRRSGQQNNAGGDGDRVAGQPDKRVGKAQKMRLFGLSYRAATDNRIEIAVRHVSWIFSDLDFVVSYNGRA